MPFVSLCFRQRFSITKIDPLQLDIFNNNKLLRTPACLQLQTSLTACYSKKNVMFVLYLASRFYLLA